MSLERLSNLLVILLVLANFQMLGTSRIGMCVRMVALQALLLGVFPLLRQWGELTAEVVIVAAASTLLKSVVLPAMLGRAIFGRPWLFAAGEAEIPFSGEMNTTPTPPKETSASLEKRLRVMVEHTKLFEELLGDIKSFAIMKKHFKAYCEGFPGAKELRIRLMETENAAEVEQIIKEGYSRG